MMDERTQATLAHLLERKRSYQQACGSETTALFMADLARFCRADRSCFDSDSRIHAMMEGRREVWLRIQEHLNWSPELMAQVYSQGTIDPTEGESDV